MFIKINNDDSIIHINERHIVIIYSDSVEILSENIPLLIHDSDIYNRLRNIKD